MSYTTTHRFNHALSKLHDALINRQYGQAVFWARDAELAKLYLNGDVVLLNERLRETDFYMWHVFVYENGYGVLIGE